ncbi:hypothetical protein FZC79_19025 [Rossellomorea vietnamensis]|uniref:Uncharacterized protein n=1 Tax=Rossellomorea vietnamensis TaxID=218284 RepID=A0A5D4K9B1_9BACI|nr:hypothetical protein [Rossellomorea vietnamensis]TYR73345.1 hypothetical protein FZC79_19025 [Rossellomorea vietnamensis]
MKKLIMLLGCMLTLLTLPLSSTTAFADDPIIKSIDEKLEKTDSYYQKGSAGVKDFIDLTMEVAINEDEVESQKVKMVFVKYKIDRDTIFHFNKQEIFYYSLDNEALLENGSVIGNGESKEFIASHHDDYRKQISPGSLVLILTLIFGSVLVFPYVIFLVQRNTPSDERYHYDL